MESITKLQKKMQKTVSYEPLPENDRIPVDKLTQRIEGLVYQSDMQL